MAFNLVWGSDKKIHKYFHFVMTTNPRTWLTPGVAFSVINIIYKYLMLFGNNILCTESVTLCNTVHRQPVAMTSLDLTHKDHSELRQAHHTL